ncbi:MAG: calcium/sodium antiporter [Cytophagales bacterium]|nr:calcium/sodium antiporter [Cytophagales bacterium]
MLFPILLLLIGFVVLIKGADFLVNGASSVAKQKGISNIAIGLTVVALGTSMPEMIVSVFSAVDGRPDAAFGNVIGSNNFNILLILGLSGAISPLVVQRNTIKYEVPLSFLAAFLLFFLVNDAIWGGGSILHPTGGVLSRLDSFILLALFIVFLWYIYRTMRVSSEAEEGEPIKIYTTPISIGLIVLGLAMLVGGGKLVIDNAVSIAQEFGMSEKLIGLTILAIGTSLPELATSLVAAYRRNTDIAIGNVVGSNIFNILLILGVTGTITPVNYSAALNFDLLVFMGSTILLMIFMFTLNARKLDRWESLILVMSYIVYTAYLIAYD